MTATPTQTRVALPSLGFSTRVLRSGRGRPLLLLHGSPDSAAEWEPVMRELGGRYDAIAPDLPGLGLSDEPPAAFDFTRASLEGFVDALLAALDVREPIVLVVHDIGGVIGVPWAARNPQRVAGIVMTNTVVFEHFPWFGLARAWAAEDATGRATARLRMAMIGAFGGVLFRRAFGRVSPELSRDDVERMTNEFALAPVAKRSTLRLFRQMLKPELFAGVDRDVATLIAAGRARVVWGANDPYIPVSYFDRLSGAPSELVDGGGHWIPISRPARVVAAIDAFSIPLAE